MAQHSGTTVPGMACDVPVPSTAYQSAVPVLDRAVPVSGIVLHHTRLGQYRTARRPVAERVVPCRTGTRRRTTPVTRRRERMEGWRWKREEFEKSGGVGRTVSEGESG
eukprot:433695-Rhodomonas_salina.1